MPGQLTLQAKLDQITGSSDLLASLRITLCNFGTYIPAIVGTSTVARGQYVAKQVTSPLTVQLWGNDVITPNTTFYCIEVIDSKGVVIQAGNYRLTGTATLDLSNLTPFLSPAPPPLIPPLIINELQIISGGNAPHFDGSTYTAFELQTNQDATLYVDNPVMGNLYTFIIRQDGNRNITWAANILNATIVDLQPSSTTIQTFVADEVGNLYAIGPGTWYP